MLLFLKTNYNKIIEWANIIFLFLFSVHLFNFPDKLILLWCAFAISLFFYVHQKLCLDKIFCVFALAIILNGLGTYYYLGPSMNWSLGNLVKLVAPVIIIYPFAKQLIYKKNDGYFEKVLLAIAIGTFVYSLLNHYSFLMHGFSEGGRIWSEFWTDYPMNATHHSFWGCFIVGLCGYAFVLFSEKKWIKGAIIIILIIIENIIHIAVDNRMVLCVSLVAIAVSIFLYIIFNMNNTIKIKRILLITLCALLLVIFVFQSDIFGIRSSGYFQRFVTRNGGIIKNVRFQMIYEAIKMLPSHWNGGATMGAAGYYRVHNYWLQVANVSGIFPFTLWMIVNISTVADVIKIVKASHISRKIKYMFLPMLAAVVSYLMMEPGGTESNRYIIFYVILIAMLKQAVSRNE